MSASLETARARLRRFRILDLVNMRELEGDPDVMKFTPSRVVQTEEQTFSRLNALVDKENAMAPLGVWAAELHDGTFVGWFMLVNTEFPGPELGFMLVRRQWGKGLATELATALLNHARSELGIRKIYSVTDADNKGSIHVLEKIGFEFLESRSKFEPILGREMEARIYCLIDPWVNKAISGGRFRATPSSASLRKSST